VGDADFQRKCVGKIGEVAKEGRTVLFVSHNMAAVLTLCETVYWMDGGMIRTQGKALNVIPKYLSTGTVHRERDLLDHPGRRLNCPPLMRKIRLVRNGEMTSSFETNKRFECEVECIAEPNTIKQFSLGFAVANIMGFRVFASNMKQYKQAILNSKGQHTIRIVIDHLPLSPGRYGLSLFLGNGSHDLDIVDNAIYFEVLWNTELGLAFPPPSKWGSLYVPIRWGARVE
jgi:lipopolysaccharide transport system ATP-binding protein